MSSHNMFLWRDMKNILILLRFKKKKNKIKALFQSYVNFITPWANSADNKLMIHLLFVPGSMKCQILFSRKNKRLLFQNVVC